ncbi:tetratricopeptide repeat protein [Actinomadura scrupuli]|uniref:tetratricopeptide repeat protein n=1 Tax=Actinomadura scrupuli TaxID=559629 RepID=UPI003D965E0A
MTAFPGEARVGGDAVAGDKIVHNRLANEQLPEPPRQLPLDIHGFTGRADVLARLDALTKENERELSPLIIAITGMPGIGKTALAVHWAHLVSTEFPDGHIFIDLRGFSDKAALSPREALSQALRSLGVPAGRIPADEDELAALYRSQLARKRLLIVLDNAVGAQQVHPLLPGSPTCVVIVTARNDLAGLVARDRARTLALDLLPTSEALDLVRAVAGIERTEAEPEAAAELVNMCARLPLALSVAAANLATRPQQTVADAVRVLDGGDRLSNLALGPELDEAVGAAFSLSYRGLNSELQLAFRLFGLIEGPSFTPQATGALLAVTPEAARRILSRLEAANLVQAISHDRYQLHELLREYARGRAEAEDDQLVRESAVQRLATWYLTRAQQAGRFLDRYRRTIGQELTVPPVHVAPPERHRHMDWFAQEYLNLVEVIGQISHLQWDQLTWELADAVYDFFELRRYCHENVAVHRLGLEAAKRRYHLPAQFFMRHHMAVVYRELGEFNKAFSEDQRAYELSQQVGDRYGTAATLDNMARIHLSLSNYKEALSFAGQALAILRGIGEQHGEATALDTMARGHQGLSQYREAFERAEGALVIRQDIGDQRGEAETLDNIARIYHGWGQARKALDYAKRALKIREDLGDRHGEGETLAYLGFLHMRTGQHLKAREYVQYALTIRRSIADRHGEGHALIYLSIILRRLGRYDEAVRVGLESLDVLQELGDRHGEAEALESLSRSYRRKEAYHQAQKDAERSLEISRSIGNRHGEATAINALGLISRKLGKLSMAREQGVQSLRIRLQIGDRHGEASSLDLLCKVYHDKGQLDKAYRTAQRALAIAHDVGDSYGLAVTLRAMGEIAADVGLLKESLEHLEQALALQQESGNREGEAETRRLLSTLHDHRPAPGSS